MQKMPNQIQDLDVDSKDFMDVSEQYLVSLSIQALSPIDVSFKALVETPPNCAKMYQVKVVTKRR